MAGRQPTRTPSCPQCGAPGTRPIENRRRTVVTVTWLCLEGHQWQVRWSEAC